MPENFATAVDYLYHQHQLRHHHQKQQRETQEPKTGPHKQSSRESAFSKALLHYKAQKAAFKTAESNLFHLFKSNQSGKRRTTQKVSFARFMGFEKSKARRTYTMYHNAASQLARRQEAIHSSASFVEPSTSRMITTPGADKTMKASYLESDYSSQPEMTAVNYGIG